MNSIMILHPYKHKGTWVFDDKVRGLCQEPFVGAVNEFLDEMTEQIPNAKEGFDLFFSAKPFPTHMFCLKKVCSEFGGTWYGLGGHKELGWLCPALFKYFDEAPEKVYIGAKERKVSKDTYAEVLAEDYGSGGNSE